MHKHRQNWQICKSFKYHWLLSLQDINDWLHVLTWLYNVFDPSLTGKQSLLWLLLLLPKIKRKTSEMIQNYEDVIYGFRVVHLFQIGISQSIHGFSCTSCSFHSAKFFRKSLEWNQSYGSPFTMKNNFLKKSLIWFWCKSCSLSWCKTFKKFLSTSFLAPKWLIGSNRK